MSETLSIGRAGEGQRGREGGGESGLECCEVCGMCGVRRTACGAGGKAPSPPGAQPAAGCERAHAPRAVWTQVDGGDGAAFFYTYNRAQQVL